MEILCAGGETKVNQPHLCMKISKSRDPFTLTAAFYM